MRIKSYICRRCGRKKSGNGRIFCKNGKILRYPKHLCGSDKSEDIAFRTKICTMCRLMAIVKERRMSKIKWI